MIVEHLEESLLTPLVGYLDLEQEVDVDHRPYEGRNLSSGSPGCGTPDEVLPEEVF